MKKTLPTLLNIVKSSPLMKKNMKGQTLSRKEPGLHIDVSNIRMAFVVYNRFFTFSLFNVLYKEVNKLAIKT